MVKRRETDVETLFQEALREQIGERRYSMWFGAGVRFVFSDSLLSVRVETSEFLCNWICSAFKHSIEQLCRDFCGRVLPVEFLYVGDGAPEGGLASPIVGPTTTPNAAEVGAFDAFDRPEIERNDRRNDAPNVVEAPKKRRGRPPKTSRAPSISDDPAPFLFETTPTANVAPRAVAPSSETFERAAVPTPPRRRGRPRKNPDVAPIPNSAPVPAPPPTPTPAVERSVPIQNAFEFSLSNAPDARATNVFDDADALGRGAWNLSESERVAWATGDFNDSTPPSGAPNAKTPGKRGRKKAANAGVSDAVPTPAVAPTSLFDADDEDVSRDARGFNIVKMATSSPRRGSADVASVNWATLDSFVEGFSNQLAKKVVEVAIVQPATMNPIFIYGPTSVGKTHLLEGVCDRYRRVPNRKPPLLMTAEEFTSAFVQSLRGGGAFRERFRDISLFALDDLHFLEGKLTTQTELLNVVDFLRARRVQMIFAANRPLSELTKLRGELTTRVESGVACKIENPERETLSAIFRQMALERRLVVSDDVCRYVVSRFATHARQLSGALNRLYAAHLTTGAPIDLDLAKDALADLAAANVRNIKLEDVERVVRETFGLDADSLKSKSRSKRCADPRALAMWLARKHTRSALAEIGNYFGGRRHSAVVSAQKKVDVWLKENEALDAGGATVAVADAVERMERSLARPTV